MGVRQMLAYLVGLGYKIGHGRVRKLMRKMAIMPIYPKPNLSKLGKAKYVHPYLLRKLEINHRNQVWSTDITYISMNKGFMYLYAIIDVYSRKIVGWGLYNTLDAVNAIEVLNKAISTHGMPEIINSDQGSQYTCPLWVKTLKKLEIKISMDGRGRCRDNAWIERFWWTLKHEYVYLNPQDKAADLRDGIARYISYYNNKRYHSVICMSPSQKYLQNLTSAA